MVVEFPIMELITPSRERPNSLKTLEHPHPMLREVCTEVTEFDDNIVKFSNDLLELCRWHTGLGMAAPQVGNLKRIIVVDTNVLDYIYSKKYTEQGYPKILINPVITNPQGRMRYKEGCLSLPGVSAWVSRCRSFGLAYQTELGESKTLDISVDLVGDPYGIVVQHEVDHLNGIEFIDNIDIIEKNKVQKQINKLRKKQ